MRSRRRTAAPRRAQKLVVSVALCYQIEVGVTQRRQSDEPRGPKDGSGRTTVRHSKAAG